MTKAWVKIDQAFNESMIINFDSDKRHCIGCIDDAYDGYGNYESACCCTHDMEYKQMIEDSQR